MTYGSYKSGVISWKTKGAQRVFARLPLSAFCLLWLAAPAAAQYGRPPMSTMPKGGAPDILKEVKIEQRLGSQVPLDATFRDESGRAVRLGEYFEDGKPVVLSLVYYECPMLCNQILNGLVGALDGVSFTPGEEFRVVTVSFDPRETPEMAARKKETYLRRYKREGAGDGWHFLTGEKAEIDRLAESAGFGYAWDERSNQFAHASAIMVTTPEGRLSHYFYGIDYDPRALRLSLVEASDNKIGSPVDALLLYCYHYDPTTGKYGPVIMNILRVAGVLTVAGVVALVLVLRKRGAGGRGERWDDEINVGGAA
ncbi:MAG TPA: SCO family protein [Pyrinomonadaceae bacterium]|nr:SCO family protein [Pyrinomonadaceae bacterium]